MSQQGSVVKMAVVGIGGNYEGELSGDGNSIAGTWSNPGFEVATIKSCNPDTPGRSILVGRSAT